MNHRSLLILASALVFWAKFSVNIANAEPVSYQIDPTKSFLAVTANLLIFPVTEQFPNSLLASVSGQINADVGESMIQFQSAAITPDSLKIVAPANFGEEGTAPGNYGGNLDLGPYGTGTVAYRDLVFTMNSDVLERSSSIPTGTMLFRTTNGSLDFSIGFFGTGRDDFSNLQALNTAGPATLTQNGNLETIVIPVNIHLAFGDASEARFIGEITASRERTSTLAADFDGDGDVDGADMMIWQRGIRASGALKSHGDADGDGDVDSDDLAIWKSQYGTSVSVNTMLRSSALSVKAPRRTFKTESTLSPLARHRNARPFRPAPRRR